MGEEEIKAKTDLLARGRGGGRVLALSVAYKGMCHWTGYGFLPLCPIKH